MQHHAQRELTIVTQNCLGLPVPVPGLRRRLRALGSALANLGADVACLQEVGSWRHLPALRHADHSWPNAVAITHPYAPKGGLVTLARPQMIHTAYHAFVERGSLASLHATERYQGKGVLSTTIVVGDEPIIVFNTHLAANYAAQWSYTNPYARVERSQLRELAQLVRDVPLETLVIVAGDFNVPRRSWLYEEFRAATGLIDPLADATEPTYRPLPGLPARAAQALDHVFVRAPQTADLELHSELCFGDQVMLAHGTHGFLSDHLGVRLTVRWQATQV